MNHYLSGFGEDGYCSEGLGYWGYGFGHYLYLAQILYDFTEGRIDLFAFNNAEKMKNVGTFLKALKFRTEPVRLLPMGFLQSQVKGATLPMFYLQITTELLYPPKLEWRKRLNN